MRAPLVARREPGGWVGWVGVGGGGWGGGGVGVGVGTHYILGNG